MGWLYGGRTVPTFEDHNQEDVRRYMEHLRLPGKLKDQILSKWDADRESAVDDLRAAERQVEIQRAESAHAEAWNYFLTNSLYLSDPLTDAAAKVFSPLREVLAHARFPEGGKGTDRLKLQKDAEEYLERLRRALRDELRVEDSSGNTSPTAGG